MKRMKKASKVIVVVAGKCFLSVVAISFKSLFAVIPSRVKVDGRI